MVKKEDPYEEQLKKCIRNTEERFISYKKMLEGVHRDHAIFPPNEPWVLEYKSQLRDLKNYEESRLKELVEEKTYYPCSSPTMTRIWFEGYQKRVEKQRAIANLRSLLGILESEQL